MLSLVLVLALVFANFSGMEVKAEGAGETGTGKKSLAGAKIELNLEDVDLEYDGIAKMPSVKSVSVESASVETDCYEIEYSNNVVAGTATVTLKGTGDYEGSSSTTFTINKRKITIKNIPAKDKTYDGSDTAELDFENVTFDRQLIANDDVKVTANGSFANKNAGDNKRVTIKNIKLTGNRAANYELNNKSLNTTANIKKRPLEIAWDDLSDFQFDGSQHKVMASITNKIENDEVELQYDNNTASDVGNYTAKITRLTGKDAENYSIDSSSTVEKKWSIGKASRTVEIKNNLDKTYDGVAVETPEIESSAGKGEENTVEYTYFDASGNPLAKAPKDAGTYKVKVTVNSKKYEEASIEKEFKINPKMVKVIVDNKEKIEGKEDPEFTYTMEGDVVQGDSLGITLTRDEGEKAGIYTIHATLSNKNYEAEITEGVFTIKPSDKPTPGPSGEPTTPPTTPPTEQPTASPSVTPTLAPTPAPTVAPDMKISQSPVDAEGEYFVPVGKEVELQITVENADKANLEYQWYCDGKKVDGNSDKFIVKLKKKGTVIYTCDIYNKVTKETKKEAGSWKVTGYKEKVSITIKKTKKINDILGKNVSLSEIKVPKSVKKALTVNVKKGTIKMKKYCKNAKVTLVTKDGQSISITVTTAYPKPVLKVKKGALKTYTTGTYRSFSFKKYNIKGAKKVVLQYSKNKKKGYKSTTLKTVSIRKNTSFYIRIAVYYVKGKSTYSEPVKIKG